MDIFDEFFGHFIGSAFAPKPGPLIVYDTPGVILDPTTVAKQPPLFLHDTPHFEIRLVDDTGDSDTDRLTSDPSLRGWFLDAGGITAFQFAIDSNAPDRFVDAAAAIDAGGTFRIDEAQLDAAAGAGGLADGTHTVHLRGVGDNGRVTTGSFTFTLDSSGPTLGGIGLDRASDTGYLGDGRTETAIVDLSGWTEAFATISVDGIETTASSRGRFTIADVHLDHGTYDYDVTVTDRAGNATTSAVTYTRLENSVLHWNDLALDAIQAAGTAPMYATRLLAMQSEAMLEAVEAVEAAGQPWHGWLARLLPLGVGMQEAAIAQAAHDILISVYAGDTGPYHSSAAMRRAFDDALAASLAEIPDGLGEWRGKQIGHRIAMQIVAERAGDGWNAIVDPQSEISDGTGEWRPTPTGYADPLAPQWGDVQPWLVQSADQFSPPAPHAIGSTEYATAYEEVRTLGAADSEAHGLRTADQTQIALFWADGPGTFTPPGHWNQIASEAAADQGRTTAEIAALMAKLNIALADAAITCWNAKYSFDYWRPVTAIRLGDADGNALTTGAAAWTPLIATPPFPEYTSGHSTFSGAAATILTAEFGDNYAFTTGTPSTMPELIGVTRSFTSFWDAAREAGQSRIYGGIHFQQANQEGLLCGQQIGNWVLSRFGS